MFMKKIYLVFIIAALFSIGCINFNYEPSINIKINEEKNESIVETEPLPQIEILEKNIYEILDEKNYYCVLDEENEKIEIKFQGEVIEIIFNKSNYFINTKSINCVGKNCTIQLNDSSKTLDYEFLKTFALLYEDYVFECIK